MNLSESLGKIKLESIVFLVLLTLLIIFYWPWLTNTSAFFEGDADGFFEPFCTFISSQIKSGNLPLWNPYPAGGMPQIALVSPGVFYPCNLFFWYLPFSSALAISMIFHQLMAVFGTYKLICKFNWSKYSALLAGIIYGFNCFIFSLVINYTLVAAATWIPWLFWSLLSLKNNSNSNELNKQKPNLIFSAFSFKHFVLISVFTFLLISAGRPEIFVPTLVSALAIVLSKLIMSFPQTFLPKIDLTKNSILQFLFSSLSLILGLGLSAVVILPALEWLPNSPRAAGLSLSEILAWSVSWYDFISLFCMQALGESFSFINPFQKLLTPSLHNLPFVSSVYLGPAVLALAFVGLLDKSWSFRYYVFAALIFIASLAAGQNTIALPFLVKLFPFLKILRYPIKLLIFFNFIMAILAARGFESAFVNGGLSRVQKFLPIVIWIQFALLAWLVNIDLSACDLILKFFNSYLSSESLAKQALGSISSAFITASFIALITHIELLFVSKSRVKSWVLICIIFLVCSFMTAFQYCHRAIDVSLYNSPSYAADRINKIASERKIYPKILPFYPIPLQIPLDYHTPGKSIDSESLALYSRQTLDLNIFQDYKLQSLSSYEGADTIELKLILAECQKRSSLFVPSGEGDDLLLYRVCQMTGTNFVLSQIRYYSSDISFEHQSIAKLPEKYFELVDESKELNLRIYLVKDCKTRAYLCNHWQYCDDRINMLKQILNCSQANLDPANNALVHRSLSARTEFLPLSLNKSEDLSQNSSKVIINDDPKLNLNKLSLDVSVKERSLLILTDTFYPGWKAYLDGKSVRVFRVNSICRGVFVDPGKHNIVFYFEPECLRNAFFLVALSILILFVCAFFRFRHVLRLRHIWVLK